MNKSINPVIAAVMAWASVLQGEAEGDDQPYLWTQRGLSILNLLKVSKNCFIGIIGERGIGKSILAKQLISQMLKDGFKVENMTWATSNSLVDTIGNLNLDDIEKTKFLLAILIKQLGYAKFQDWLYHTFILPFEKAETNYISFEGTEKTSGMQNAETMFSSALRFVLKNTIPREWTEKYNKSLQYPLPKPEQLMPVLKKALNQKTEPSTFIADLVSNLRNVHTLFIDLPDYSEHQSKKRMKHADLLFDLWSKIRSEGVNTNIVVFQQKELFGGHFVIHKMLKEELPKFSPNDLLQIYKMRFETTQPFTEKALLKLGQLSRGNCRYFKVLISRVIEYWLNTEDHVLPIALEFVNKNIKTEDKKDVMSLELSALFPKSLIHQEQALQILDLLYDKEKVSQQDVIDPLAISQAACSKLLNLMYNKGLITYTWENGKKFYAVKLEV